MVVAKQPIFPGILRTFVHLCMTLTPYRRSLNNMLFTCLSGCEAALRPQRQTDNAMLI